MKLNTTPRVALDDPLLTRELREHASQVNLLTEGRISAAHNASTAPPPAGSFQAGDYIRNSSPVELGGSGSKYVIEGWMCVSPGTPGTWVQKRFLTGN